VNCEVVEARGPVGSSGGIHRLRSLCCIGGISDVSDVPSTDIVLDEEL
jgi:hypothetical protein